jgi:hypothetical protein
VLGIDFPAGNNSGFKKGFYWGVAALFVGLRARQRVFASSQAHRWVAAANPAVLALLWGFCGWVVVGFSRRRSASRIVRVLVVSPVILVRYIYGKVVCGLESAP